MKNLQISIFILFLLTFSIQSQELGKYFAKKQYESKPIPNWAESKEKLPEPVLDGNPGWIDMYWKCWEIAFRGFKQPQEGSPLVSNWLDEAFSENIFQWDTIFMMMFARYGHDVFPAIESLDNFYRLQYESGFIGREFREKDGKLVHFDFNGGLFSDKGWKNMINPPLFSWAEVESFRVTGDKSRFEMILPALEKYAEWLNRDGDPEAKDWEMNGRISKSTEHKLYWNTPLGSGMDNTPRPVAKGAGWVEMSAQMVIMYNNLAIICEELGDEKKGGKYKSEAAAIADRINKWCWNEEDGFYYDVLADGTQFKKKTISGYWPLLAGIANKDQAGLLVKHLKNEKEFWRKIVIPTLSADEEEYNEYGGYWLGGVWAPTNVMVIKGLEKYGYENFATEITDRYLNGMYEVFKETGTVYENYAPDYFLPGNPSKADFVGWTGCGPIQLLIENIIGLRPNVTNNTLVWILNRLDKHGIKDLKLGNNKISVICEKRESISSPVIINVNCIKPFNLKLITIYGEKEIEVLKSSETIIINF
jgi:glycogen debranching enzyme